MNENQIKTAMEKIEYTEDFSEFLNSVGVDSSHSKYDDFMAGFMFGGCDPNEIADAIHERVNLAVDFGKENSDYQPGHDFEHDFQQ